MGKIILKQAFVWLCIWCGSWTSVTGSLLVRPQTQTVAHGQRVVMKCRTSLSYSVDWHVIPDNGKREEIYSSGVLSPLYSEYRIEKGDLDGEYDLVIESVAERHAGKYICIDDEGLGSDSASAMLKLSNGNVQNDALPENSQEQSENTKAGETDDKGDTTVVPVPQSTTDVETAHTTKATTIPIIVGLTVGLTAALVIVTVLLCYCRGRNIRHRKPDETKDPTQNQRFLQTDLGKATTENRSCKEVVS